MVIVNYKKKVKVTIIITWSINWKSKIKTWKILKHWLKSINKYSTRIRSYNWIKKKKWKSIVIYWINEWKLQKLIKFIK